MSYRAVQVHNLMWTPISFQLIKQIVNFINFFFLDYYFQLWLHLINSVMIFVKFIYKASSKIPFTSPFTNFTKSVPEFPWNYKQRKYKILNIMPRAFCKCFRNVYHLLQKSIVDKLMPLQLPLIVVSLISKASVVCLNSIRGQLSRFCTCT